MLESHVNCRQKQLKLVKFRHTRGKPAYRRLQAMFGQQPHPLLLKAGVPDHVVHVRVWLIPPLPVIHEWVLQIGCQLRVHKIPRGLFGRAGIILVRHIQTANRQRARRNRLHLLQKPHIVHRLHHRRLRRAHKRHNVWVIVAHHMQPQLARPQFIRRRQAQKTKRIRRARGRGRQWGGRARRRGRNGRIRGQHHRGARRAHAHRHVR